MVKFDDAGAYTSIYKDEIASPSEIKNAVAMLSAAFPMDNKEEQARFYALLTSRIAANNFTSKRLADAIGNLIDNHPYKTIKIADVISYDKKIKLYSYNEYCREVGKFENAHKDFKVYGKIDDITYWYRQSELHKTISIKT